MSQLYRDYFWKEGIPYGRGALEASSQEGAEGYKIAMDPYRKRISIEHYQRNPLPTMIYDSALLDFRHLKLGEQNAWQKTLIQESPQQAVCLLRDQNDRLAFIETYLFVQEFCRECRVVSGHGIALSTHRMYYTLLNDPFDGVILYDAHAHPVMRKRYLFDRELHQFTDLLEEQWDLGADPSKGPLPSPTAVES